MRAPGIELTGPLPRPGTNDVPRADIVGFAGIFERGPVLVPRRVEDAGELHTLYGGLVPIPGAAGGQALSPLALRGFFQNGGATCVVYRLASPAMRAAKARFIDPATGQPIGLVASSPGAWANGVRISVPLTVLRRASAPRGFPLSSDLGFKPGSLVRVTDRAFKVVFGTLEGAAPSLRLRPARTLRAPLVVEEIDPDIVVTIEGAGRRERFHDLSLLPDHPRRLSLARFFAAARPLPSTWFPSIPPAWQPLSAELALALDHQGPAASELLRSVALAAPDGDGFAPLEPLWSAVPASPERAGAAELTIELAGGLDALTGVDEAAFRAAFGALAQHPAPSIVCVPELMLPLMPVERACDEWQRDVPLEPPAPPPPCGPIEPTKRRRTLLAEALPATEARFGELPGYGASVPMLQEELLATLAGCVEGRERIALLDPFPGVSPAAVAARAGELAGVLAAFGGPLAGASGLGTMLYPWIYIVDPRAPGRRSALVPPSGHVAGLLASATRERGPSTPFAAVSISGAVAVERELSEGERADLNERGVSALRVIARRGVVVFGERTVKRARGADRYVPGARVLAFLRRVLRVVGETLVFEPNDPPLRLYVLLVLEGVLRELFLEGAFAGATEAEAYAVRCDEAQNPPESVALGRLIAEVDVALSVPLEFLTIRVAFSRDAAAVLDDVSAKEP